MIKKRAQAWGFDLMVATAVFLMGALIFFVYALNIYSDESNNLKLIRSAAESVGDSLLSEGLPSDWNITNVIRPGILTDNKINSTKLERVYILSLSDYNRSKILFGITYEYFLNFTETITINGSLIQGIGKPIENPSDLIKISRFTVYQNKPMTANIYIWK